MKVLDLINKRIIITNFIIIIALDLFFVLNSQIKSLNNPALGVVVAFTIVAFDNVIKNYKGEEHNRKKRLINIFTHCGIYIIIYGLILFIFRIETIIIIKIMTIQIFSLVYSISRNYISKGSYKNKVVFYVIFFLTFTGTAMHWLHREMNFINFMLSSTALASTVSALFCIFIKLDIE